MYTIHPPRRQKLRRSYHCFALADNGNYFTLNLWLQPD